eukprot:Rmarinus@m.9991
MVTICRPRIYSNLVRQLVSRTLCACKSVDLVLREHCPTQVEYLKETILLVDENDRFHGTTSKKDAHLNKYNLLHRAFSVFLFDDKNRLLVQQRADEKITFPGLWTNTCCSHPLGTPEETESKNASGVKRAARRKLHHELGVPTTEIRPEDFHYLGRIHYGARSCATFGEHEIDYILFLRQNVTVTPNPNEVQAYNYYDSIDNLEAAVQSGLPVTPWFRMMLTSGYLRRWWGHLDSLHEVTDEQTIIRLALDDAPVTT